MTQSPRAANVGFTLLEILVAFTIATTALGLLFHIHARATATVVLSAEYHEATLLMQGLIAELSVTERQLAFVKSGSIERYEWTVRAEEYTAEAGDQGPPYRLRRIAAEVSWMSRDRERQVELDTIKPFFDADP